MSKVNTKLNTLTALEEVLARRYEKALVAWEAEMRERHRAGKASSTIVKDEFWQAVDKAGKALGEEDHEIHNLLGAIGCRILGIWRANLPEGFGYVPKAITVNRFAF